MKPVDRQKICGHCDGRIAVEAQSCPYCASPCITNVSSPPLYDHKSIQDSLTALYSPPYSNNKAISDMKHDKDKLKSKSFGKESHENHLNASLGKVGYTSSPPMVDAENIQQQRGVFAPMFFLLLGSNLLIVALLQLLFSEEGVLRLQWQSKFWYVYALIGLPAIFFGLRKAAEMENKDT